MEYRDFISEALSKGKQGFISLVNEGVKFDKFISESDIALNVSYGNKIYRIDKSKIQFISYRDFSDQ
ncbi:hypothetical protein [Macrococcus brunensis]|uniref:hypothetical protein n=1 Tax=Macrococcus brunensis TaxID=198483 RepID=UPI001EF0F6B8|nr:hypothetical protein [Macrococcus brunensis]ULG73212.1 hypothetical protein MGG13_05660 [Macrococcus brunensis]